MASRAALRIGPPAFAGSEFALIASLEGQIRDAVRSDLDVLVSGGTEQVRRLLAKVIHRRSLRGRLPFVVLDPTYVATSILGWSSAQLPHAATVFVAEIAELTTDSQMLLGQLLEGRARGRAQRTLDPSDHTDVQPRIVSGTAYDLTKRIQNGTFSRDLFYRLNTVHLVLPHADDAAERDRTA